jgi:ribosomal protein L37AE/L43A
MAVRTKIIDVERKPSKCPVCGSEVVDIIYGTGDMTEIDFLFEYRKAAIMGGDNIPRRPPIWACSCCCKRFRKVNPDGSNALVKVKLLKNMRKDSIEKFTIETSSVESALMDNTPALIKHYRVRITTDCDETEVVNITATSPDEALMEAKALVDTRRFGFKGRCCISAQIE